jgi:hypothetical protein
VLFVDADAGEYGCLAEWDRREDAEAFADRPAVREELARLAARVGRAPRVRVYAMEETIVPPPETGSAALYSTLWSRRPWS